MHENPSDEQVEKLLNTSKIIAVVGLSDNISRDSFIVADFLKKKGYRIIPVNPSKDTIIGEKCYSDLRSIPEKIDIVDIFRNIEAVPGIVNEAINIKPGAIWLQEGLVHEESAEKSKQNNIIFIQSLCIKKEHCRLLRK